MLYPVLDSRFPVQIPVSLLSSVISVFIFWFLAVMRTV